MARDTYGCCARLVVGSLFAKLEEYEEDKEKEREGMSGGQM